MNIVVICSDTFRYDHLGFLKKHEVFTPNLDKLAQESACFSDFRFCSFPTLVNRIEVFTGRYTFPLINWGNLPRHHPVLSEVFKANGFTTALIADNPHLFENNFGFERGFDFVKNVPGQTHDPFQPKSTPMIGIDCSIDKLDPPSHRIDRYRRNAYWYKQQGTSTTIEVFRESMAWLDHPPEKFFLWIDAFDPHEPWDAPSKYLEPYPWEPNADKIFWPKSGESNRYTDAELINIHSLYKAEVTQIDFLMGQLLEKLQNQGLLDDTVIIFTSDHGYYFGEHGSLGKPLRCKEPLKIYDELAHIPLLIRHPKGLSSGKTIRGLTQPTDLYKTLLEFAGIETVPWAQGWSLVPRLHSHVGEQEFAVSGCFPHKGRLGCLTAWTDEWCMVYSPFTGVEGAELFHKEYDPTNNHNVAIENRLVVKSLIQNLNQWFDDLKVSTARKNQLLNNERFSGWNNIQYKADLVTKSLSYWVRYPEYWRGN